ncbi:hypothetical protein U1Q18_025136 [Sarracenia purpurea var. burkii]
MKTTKISLVLREVIGIIVLLFLAFQAASRALPPGNSMLSVSRMSVYLAYHLFRRILGFMLSVSRMSVYLAYHLFRHILGFMLSVSRMSVYLAYHLFRHIFDLPP